MLLRGLSKVPTGRRHQAVRLLQSAAALRNGVLDGVQSNFWPRLIYPLLNPPPGPPPWCRHAILDQASRLFGRILGDKIAFQEKYKNIKKPLGFSLFLSPRRAQHPTKWPPKTLAVLSERTSEDDLTYQGYLGPSWPRFWGDLGPTLRLLGSILAPTWRPRSLQSRPRAPKSCPR